MNKEIPYLEHKLEEQIKALEEYKKTLPPNSPLIGKIDEFVKQAKHTDEKAMEEVGEEVLENAGNIVEKLKEQVNGRYQYKIVYINRQRGNNFDANVDMVRQAYNAFSPFVVKTYVDKSQFGDYLLDELAKEGVYLDGFYFSPDNRINIIKNMGTVFNHGDGLIVMPRKNGLPERDENARTEELTDILTRELTQIEKDVTPKGAMTYRTTGKHDDMAISLALALFAALSEMDVDTYIRKNTY